MFKNFPLKRKLKKVSLIYNFNLAKEVKTNSIWYLNFQCGEITSINFLSTKKGNCFSQRNISKNNFCAFWPHRVFLQVQIRSSMILNGVSVFWQGWIDLIRLDGMGCLEFDEDLAQQEDLILKKQVKYYNKANSDRQLHELWMRRFGNDEQFITILCNTFLTANRLFLCLLL